MIALMYHDVLADGREDASGFPGPDARSYKITARQFRSHLDAILAALSSLPAPPGLPAPPALVFTFDDGGASARIAADELESHGLRGCFFITGSRIGSPAFVDLAAIRDLDRRGHVVGSHSWSHPLRIGHCSRRQLAEEWTRSRDVLAEAVGHPIGCASVPGGDFAPAVAEAAAHAGLTNLFTSEPTSSSRHAYGLTVHGRYTIRSWTRAATAAALARGGWLPRGGQALVWNVKKLGKRLGGEQYLRCRRLILGDEPGVRWGDCRD
jgi:peptidoglycan/xylan/chitin deacetylase (PgdA/CDA1 family)